MISWLFFAIKKIAFVEHARFNLIQIFELPYYLKDKNLRMLFMCLKIDIQNLTRMDSYED
jgi:hypothetical protein